PWSATDGGRAEPQNRTKARQFSRGSADRAIGFGGFSQCRTGRSHAWSHTASSSRSVVSAWRATRRSAAARASDLIRTRIEIRPPLFPGYCFLTVEAQWYAARWSIGVIGLVMDGIQPARVSDQIIDHVRKRERYRLIELPGLKLRPGDGVRLLRGPFAGHWVIFAGMKPRERVEVLLTFLGAQQRVPLSQDAVERVQY